MYLCIQWQEQFIVIGVTSGKTIHDDSIQGMAGRIYADIELTYLLLQEAAIAEDSTHGLSRRRYKGATTKIKRVSRARYHKR